MLGEIRLRLKGTKSVPMLVDGGRVLGSSLAIAQHADASGSKSKLFDRDVDKWVLLSDRMIDVGRSRVMKYLATDRTAQEEAVPSFAPRFLAPMTASMAAWYLGRKHEVRPDTAAETERELVPALRTVREALYGREFLVGDAFSFADIAIASALRAVSPEERAEIGPGTRRGWTDEALAKEYADLLAWRDRLYARYR